MPAAHQHHELVLQLGTNMIDDAVARPGRWRNVVRTVPSWFEIRGVIANTDRIALMPRRWAHDPAFSAGCMWQRLPLDEVTFAVDLCWRTRDGRDPGQRALIIRTVNAEPRPGGQPQPARRLRSAAGQVRGRVDVGALPRLLGHIDDV
jgi:DNA-binding transcriptional LysR family regulator